MKYTTMPVMTRLLDVHRSKDKRIRLWDFASFALVNLVYFGMDPSSYREP
jgi:hypothetical protein